MKMSRLRALTVMMPVLLLVLLAAGIGFGYYEHREVSERLPRQKQHLYCNTPGELFMHPRFILEITARVNDLDIRRISVRRFCASDARGTQCPWMSRLFAYSEGGPGMVIEIDARAAKDVLMSAGEFRYKGKMYSIEAKWEEKPTDGTPSGMMIWQLVSCKIQPSVSPPD